MNQDDSAMHIDEYGSPTDPEPELVVETDGFTRATINSETGEILGVEDAPAEANMDILRIIDWVGMRRMRVSARLAAVETEKAEWYANVDRQFDTKIRHLQRFLQYLDTAYTPMLREFAAKSLEGKKTKTLKIAFMELSFGTTRARVDVMDNDKAVAFCESNKLANAIKIVKSVLKSAIPESIKIKLTADTQDETGIVFYPGGEETFQIK